MCRKLFSAVINKISKYPAKIHIYEIVSLKLLHIIHPGEFFSLMGFCAAEAAFLATQQRIAIT